MKTRKKQGNQATKPHKGGRSLQYVLFFLVIAVAWWVVSKEDNKAAKVPPPQADTVTLLSTKEIAHQQKSEKSRTQMLVSERAGGLRPLPVVLAQDGSIQLDVKIRSFSRGCAPGDLDIIKNDLSLMGLSEAGLLLSLESLDPAQARQPSQLSLPLASVKDGFHHSFSVPAPDKVDYLGLMLCTQNTEKRCVKQSMSSMSDLGGLQRWALTDLKKAATYPRQPKVYFFQLVIAFHDRLMLFDTTQGLDSGMSRLQKVLESHPSRITPPYALLHETQGWMAKIDSLPALVNGQSMALQLPYKAANCP